MTHHDSHHTGHGSGTRPASAHGDGHASTPRFSTDFHLNPAFVEEVGPERAEAFRQVLASIGTEYRHHRVSEIRAALTAAIARIGVAVSPVEIDKFADEIARSDNVTAELDG